MFMILIGGVLVAISAAAIVALPFRLARRKVPKGVPALAAGLALVAFVVWNDYSWYGRTVAALPESVVVTDTYTYSGAWQPWTYVVPRINRFTAVDGNALRRHPDLPGHTMAELLLVSRYQPVRVVTRFYDCEAGRVAEMTASTRFADNGLPENVDWQAIEDSAALRAAVCPDDASRAPDNAQS